MPTLGFAIQANKSHRLAPVSGSADRTPSGRPFCTYYHRLGHTFNRCFTRLGVSPQGRGRNRGKPRHPNLDPPAYGQQ